MNILPLGLSVIKYSAVGVLGYLTSAQIIDQIARKYPLAKQYEFPLCISGSLCVIAISHINVPLTFAALCIAYVVTSKPTAYQAKISMGSRTGGLIGDLNHDLLDFQELNRWKYRDDRDLPFKPDTLLLRFHIYDQPKSLLPMNPYLPAYLFENVKNGDIIQLKYNDQVVDLEVDQATIATANRWNSTDFEGYFKCAHTNTLQKIEWGDLGFSGGLFDKYNDLEGYTLDHDGILFQLYSTGSIQKAERQELRELEKIKLPPSVTQVPGAFPLTTIEKYIPILRMDKVMRLTIPLCGISNHVDIVVNEKFLCFYAKDCFKVIEKQILYISQWRKYFENISTAEMQDKVAQAKKISWEDGFLTLDIPL